MENNRRNNNNRNNGYKGKGNGNRNNNYNNRNNNRNNNNRFEKREEQPQRRRRVSVPREVEVVIISNTPSRFFYENPRVSVAIDLQQIGDEEYLTVGDLRQILNSNRKLLEGFTILITDVMDSNYTLEDVLVFLGLDKKYDEYYSLNRKKIGEPITAQDIKEFLLNSPANSFEKTMEKIDDKLRSRVIEQSVVLFKLKEFGDYNKMRVIESYVNEDLFADAQETELDEDVYI